MSEDSGIVRKLITATIVDTRFLKGLRYIWHEELVGSAWAWIARKSFDHLDKYGSAPGKNIETIWQAETHVDADTKHDLESLLGGLSEEYEEALDVTTSDLLLKEAERHFKRELILNELVQIEAAAEEGDVEQAELLLNNLELPRILDFTSIDPASNPELLEEAFLRQPVPLVQLGGAFQEQVGSQIVRDSFVAFLGKEKVGKTWLLQSLAFSGVKAKNRVLFCQCGDLSVSQQLIRLSIQLTGRSNKLRYCAPQLLPVPDCLRNQDNSCQRSERKASEGVIEDEKSKPYPTFLDFDLCDSYETCNARCPETIPSSWWERLDHTSPLTWQEAFNSWKRFKRAVGDLFRLEWFPTRSVNIHMIDHKLNQLKDSGWVPDIVIVDYFDIMAPEPKTGGDFRHVENARWEAGRRLSQEWNCALVTATQANRDSYSRRVLSVDNTSEDKRKGAHVTAFFGLNKDVHDKARNWMRVNPLLVREDDFDEYDQCVVMQLLQRGAPNLGSFWLRRKGVEE